MVSVVTLFFISLPVYYFGNTALNLWKNVKKAKRSGLPYVIIPIYGFNPLWLLTGRRIVKWFVRKFPNLWISNYLLLMIPEWSWKYGYEPFRRYGDTFMTVTPVNCHIWIADREVISQISSRRDDFPKPAWMYRTINMYGRNVVTTEGSEWKFHRKVTSPSFGERNNALVFEETIRQGRQMLKKWTGEDGSGNRTIHDVLEDTMRLSLHVISGAGFGVSLQWPGATKDSDIIQPLSSNSTHKHTLSFKDALAGLLHNLLLVLIFPKWILRNMPFQWARDAAKAAVEYETYMNELFNEKRMEAIAGEKADGMDIMGVLVKNSYGPENKTDSKPKAKAATARDIERQTLTDSEILGNAFVFLLAGHETSAGALHYGLILLALHPDSQRHLQSDIDKIFGDRPIEEWDYNKDITALQSSMVGAVMHEELRLIPPVINIPKQVSDDQDQIVYWPSTEPSKFTGQDTDLENFVPERWLARNRGSDINHQEAGVGDVGNEGSAGRDAGHLYHPLKGSYIPFSDGARSCLGKRFAQVEIMILLAMIFKNYSVELAVDELADDKTVNRMSYQEKMSLYNNQRDVARSTIRNFSLVRITVQIRNADVPIRLVPRGNERFIHLL
ncbi:hypothetical protein ABW20_dc0104784 [Dactylellina cionopaga]|nr:hypothetical protein ABW20_dc0104784 [Dactylellina cionopaga]